MDSHGGIRERGQTDAFAAVPDEARLLVEALAEAREGKR